MSMREELVDLTWDNLRGDKEVTGGTPVSFIAAVLDSIPPGSYKREDETWVRLQRIVVSAPGTVLQSRTLYTEVDHAE